MSTQGDNICKALRIVLTYIKYSIILTIIVVVVVVVVFQSGFLLKAGENSFIGPHTMTVGSKKMLPGLQTL